MTHADPLRRLRDIDYDSGSTMSLKIPHIIGHCVTTCDPSLHYAIRLDTQAVSDGGAAH